ncbi:hypothetical protein PS947_03786 [Pseudomonas fluorescens]|nr:hypothetical protein PS947_03786 [Pseudomonas fluorescens]
MASHANAKVLAFYIPEAFLYLHTLLVNYTKGTDLFNQ